MKHQGQNIIMKLIQKAQTQIKPLQFTTLCPKYYQMMKVYTRRYKFVKLKANESLFCGSYMCQNYVKYYGRNVEHYENIRKYGGRNL